MNIQQTLIFTLIACYYFLLQYVFPSNNKDKLNNSHRGYCTFNFTKKVLGRNDDSKYKQYLTWPINETVKSA